MPRVILRGGAGGREGRRAADKRCHEEGEDVTKTARDDT